MQHLEGLGLRCILARNIATGQDALAIPRFTAPIITNPPYSHPLGATAALGLALVENGWRVMFTRTTHLVQRLSLVSRITDSLKIHDFTREEEKVMRGRPLAPLELSSEEEEALQSLASRRTTAQALALRARIVLLCAAGEANQAVAAKLGVTPQTMGKWRARFLALPRATA